MATLMLPRPQEWSRRAILAAAAPLLSGVRSWGRGNKVSSKLVELTDPLTERPLERLTDPAILHHLPHYHHRFIAKDNSFLLLAQEQPAGPQIFLMNLPNGDMEQVTSGPGVHSFSPTLGPRGRSFFFLQGNELKEAGLRGSRELAHYSSPGGWRATGHLTVSSDGSNAALVEMKTSHWEEAYDRQFARRPTCRIVLISLRGRQNKKKASSRVLIEEEAWLAHPQFQPRGRDLLYIHEGPWGQVDGPLRWVSFDGKRRKNLRPREDQEQRVHPYWAGPRRICYAHYPDDTRRNATVRCMDPSSGQERVVAPCTQFSSLSANSDHSAVAGASQRLAGPHIYVLFTHLRREVTLVEHGASRKSYKIGGASAGDHAVGWPEPVFSPDSQWIYFVTDREGMPAVYRMDVSDLVEETGKPRPAEDSEEG